MARILVTGSSDGLAMMVGQLLARQGHRVVLHARDGDRAEAARAALPAAEGIVEGDVSTLAGIRQVAARANDLGRFDAVIHNVGVDYREPRRIETEDGLSQVFAINVMAPYLLTALMRRPDRLVYLSSGMQDMASANLDDFAWTRRRWNGSAAYAESKLHDTMLAFALTRHWPGVRSHAVGPGWVPTRMGGPGAPDDMDQVHRTQAWLAAGEDPGLTGRYLTTSPSAPRTRRRGTRACRRS